MLFARLLELSSPANVVAQCPGELTVYEAEGYRWLCSSAAAIQSAMNLADPSDPVLPNHRAMLLAGLLPGAVASVLDLGMGAGGFLRHLQTWVPAPRITAVEKSADMLVAARTHFAVPVDQPVYRGDAAQFLAAASERFDLVLCDLFSDRSAPDAIYSNVFYADLRARVADGGAVALNTLPESADALSSIIRQLRGQFAEIAALQFPDLGNVVLLASADAMPDSATLLGKLGRSRYAGCDDMCRWLKTMIRVAGR